MWSFKIESGNARERVIGDYLLVRLYNVVSALQAELEAIVHFLNIIENLNNNSNSVICSDSK